MKETKTVQVYPDDAIVNRTIREYGSFGWEVLSNQRCQEYENGYYTTFNKITFTRETDAAWYYEVTKIEREYNAAKDTIKSYQALKPVLRKPAPQGDMAIAVGVGLYIGGVIILGVIYSIVRAIVGAAYKGQYKKALAEYNAVYPAKIREEESKMSQLRSRAEMCISKKA